MGQVKGLNSVPDFPSFREINIEDKDLFDNYFAEIQPRACELTFNSIFSWRKTENTKVSKIDETLILMSKESDISYFLPPLSYKLNSLNEIFLDILNWLKNLQKTAEVKFADEFVLSKIDRNSFNIIEDTPCFDYIYLVEDLISLKGRKYDAKRNHVKYFGKNYNYSYEEIKQNNIGEYFYFENEWCDMGKCSLNKKLMDEKTAIDEMLKNYNALSLKGGIIKIDGRVKALTIGEKLNNNTFLVNIEKADPKIRGLYQAVNQMFCKKNMAEFKYVNREEDLGILGIRKAKLSYYPVEMVKKYKIRLRNEK